MEQFRDIVLSFSGQTKEDEQLPLRLVAPNRIDDYITLRDDRFDAYYTTDRRGATAVFSLRDNRYASAMRVALHEYVHHLQHGPGRPAMPPWYREGMAEYLSGFKVERSGRWLIGGVQLGRAMELQQGRWLPLKQLVEDGLPDERLSMWYAQSWFLVHYLAEFEPAALRSFERRYAQSPSPRLLLNILRTDYADLESKLRAYLRRGQMMALAIQPTPVDPTLTTRPLPDEERDLLLGTIGLGGRELTKVREIAASRPPESLIQLTLVEKLEMEGETDEALRRLEDFLTLRPGVARGLAQKASLLLHQAADIESAEARRKALRRARDAALEANRANPDDVVPFEVLIQVGLSSDLLSRKNMEVSIENAQGLAPHRRDLILLEAAFLAQQGEIPAARALAYQVAESAEHPPLRNAARSLLDSLN
ncbi:MAG: hypothetical protein AAFZ18_17155 [Myxococcota bacterium]